ncbi:MAG: DUF1270 family protein [Staphylococcus epidermidis]|nr:DUF1270 family protein [Staphylococcus epidermidis]USL87120.1 transmembrane protein [Staphylococcus phage Sazerac]
MKESTKSFIASDVVFIVMSILLMRLFYFTTAIGISIFISAAFYLFFVSYVFDKEDKKC